jgi:predicted nucleic acid-binding protein
VIAVDTNILVYAADAGAGDRHQEAKGLLKHVIARGALMLPLQVLGEFCHTALKKLLFEAEQVERFVIAWGAVAQVEGYGLADVRAALRAHADHGLPFWDGLIWAVCERHNVELLLSEDFQDGRRLGGVTFLDPFNPANAARLGLARP